MPSLVALALAIGFGAILAGSVIGDALERRDRVAAEWATPALVQAVEAAVAASGACGPGGSMPAGGRIGWSDIRAWFPSRGAAAVLLDGVRPEAVMDPGTGTVRVVLTASDADGLLLLDRMAGSGGLEAVKRAAGSTLEIHLQPVGWGGAQAASWRMDAPGLPGHLPRARCQERPRPWTADLSHLQPHDAVANQNGWRHPWK